jgi:hypothetical protein
MTGAGKANLGTVTFYDGASPLGSAQLVGSGVAYPHGTATLRIALRPEATPFPLTTAERMCSVGAHHSKRVGVRGLQHKFASAGDAFDHGGLRRRRELYGQHSSPASVAVDASQTITLASLESVDYGTPPISLNATASSGPPVSFSLVAGPATLVGSTLTVQAAVVIVIQADQAGDATYSPAPAVRRALTVNPRRESGCAGEFRAQRHPRAERGAYRERACGWVAHADR